MESEPRTKSGNYICNARSKNRAPPRLNPAIERELAEFKEEIEQKFAASKINAGTGFKFP